MVSFVKTFRALGYLRAVIDEQKTVNVIQTLDFSDARISAVEDFQLHWCLSNCQDAVQDFANRKRH